MKLMAARTCARVWQVVDSSSLLKKAEKGVSVLWRKSRLLNHPFVQVKRGFVFIHVPKTAGTSLRQALGLIAPLDISCHSPAREVVPFIKIVAPETKAIAFVRNPYTRFLSLYNYARMPESLYHSVTCPERAPHGRNGDYDILRNKSLEQCAELLIEGKVGGHGCGFNHWQPQVDWLINRNDKIIVDFIGRVETLGADLQKLRKLYGIESGPVPRLNVSSASDAPTTLSPTVREVVRAYYKRDFEMLGYDEHDVSCIGREVEEAADAMSMAMA
jgi:hypothetical protein